MVLNMLTTSSMVQLGKVYQNTMVDLQPKSKKLRERGIRLVEKFALLPRNQAIRALESSRWNVKIAILMARKNIPYAQAVQELKKNEGFLKKCL
ncbi:MAG: hypothetical protein HYY63_02270 [Elusimicrobia bacterium]|nr:hypothetical protein [Elusimicrobiota bacterium]